MRSDCLRAQSLVQRLLARDMRRQKLSLRGAAKAGPVAIGTLALVLGRRRLCDPDRQHKRGLRRGTALVLRELTWIGKLSSLTLDRLLQVMRKGRHS